MTNLPTSLRIILIGGTSHVGKSTVARQLASDLSWEYLSTDRLARHPGRPWRHDGVAVASHVADHYAILPVEELVADVLRHYERNVLPQVETLVHVRISGVSAQGLVLEGSAIWPGSVARLLADQVAALWLTAGDELLISRVHTESRYAQRTPPERLLVDKFLQRTLAYAQRMEMAIEEHGLLSVGVSEQDTVGVLAQRCLQAIALRQASAS